MSQPRPVPASMRARLRRVMAAPAIVAAGALLAACGGSSASLNAASTERNAETKLADFARCLREHGLRAEVASMPTGGRGLKLGPPAGSGHREAHESFQAAQQACARYRPAPQTVSLSPQQKVEREEGVRKFAKCMRERGIVLEVSTRGGAIQITLHGHPGSGPNPESPSFQRAQAACQKLLPGRPGAAGG